MSEQEENPAKSEQLVERLTTFNASLFIFKEDVNQRATRILSGNKRRVWRIYASLRLEIENRTAHKDRHASRPLEYVKSKDIESPGILSIMRDLALEILPRPALVSSHRNGEIYTGTAISHCYYDSVTRSRKLSKFFRENWEKTINEKKGK